MGAQPVPPPPAYESISSNRSSSGGSTIKPLPVEEDRPGAVRVPGINSRPNSQAAASPQGPYIPPNAASDLSDIHPQHLQVLTSMGFTPAQAAHALRCNNYKVQEAAHFLLGAT